MTILADISADQLFWICMLAAALLVPCLAFPFILIWSVFGGVAAAFHKTEKETEAGTEPSNTGEQPQ